MGTGVSLSGYLVERQALVGALILRQSEDLLGLPQDHRPDKGIPFNQIPA